MRLLILLVAIQVVMAQVGLKGPGGAMMNMPQITSLDVQCEKSGMTVDINFDQPFNGIIFSKGHYSNDACRYVFPNTGQSSYKFVVPSGICGSDIGQLPTPAGTSGSRTQLTNTIIIQTDPLVQEVWDVARSIKCSWIENLVKTVAFEPFAVGMLDAKEVQFKGDRAIECWMDLQAGEYPNVNDINGVVKIGDTLSLMMYTRDPMGKYDVSVKDCYAYGGPDYDSPNTPRVQLTDEQGCLIKDKLMSSFYMNRIADPKGSIIVTYAYVKAFKFPDVMDVYMSCNMEICKGDCESTCGSAVTKRPIMRGSTLFGEPRTTLAPTTTPIPTSTEVCGPNSIDPSCSNKVPGESKPNCISNPRDPRCNNNGKTLFPQQITTRRSFTFSKPACSAGSTDPRCPQPTTTPFRCFPGSRDPRCPQPTTPFRCLPGSRDPRCPQPTTTPFRCFRGSRDPRCPQPTTSTPFRCFPGSTDPRCPQPTTPFRCLPGSRDPRCPQPTTTPFRCFRGSRDPRCPQPTTTTPFRCFAGSRDPRCPQPTTTPFRCFAGSTDPRCPKPTTKKPFFVCQPGSIDPRCPILITTTSTTPIPTTSKIRRGSTLFPNFITTTKPTTTTTTSTTTTTTPRPTSPRTSTKVKSPFRTTRRPIAPKLKPTTKSPNRGKQFVSSQTPKSVPEPSGKEWEGEAKYHAFHSYHYQRGDGRRNRIFGRRLQRDVSQIIPTNKRPLIEKKPVRLTRAVHVFAPIDLPVDFNKDNDDKVPVAEPQTYIPLPDPLNRTVCVPMTTVAAVLLGLLFMIILTTTASLVLYTRLRSTSKLQQDPYYWSNH